MISQPFLKAHRGSLSPSLSFHFTQLISLFLSEGGLSPSPPLPSTLLQGALPQGGPPQPGHGPPPPLHPLPPSTLSRPPEATHEHPMIPYLFLFAQSPIFSPPPKPCHLLFSLSCTKSNSIFPTPVH